MELIFGFTWYFIFLWTIAVLWKYKSILSMKVKIISILIFIVGYTLTITKQNVEYLPVYIYLIEILAFFSFCFLIYQRKQKKFYPNAIFNFIGIIFYN